MYSKKMLSVLLATIIIFCSMSVSFYAYEDKPKIWSGKTAESFADGDGTEESPYKIETAEQLALFAKIANKTIAAGVINAELANDIYLNDTINWELWGNDDYNDKKLNKWVPINLISDKVISDEGIYYGHINAICFNGNNHYIYGLYINDKNADAQGLFSYADIIENLNLSKSYIKGNNQVGAIAAFSKTIYNCTGNCHVEGSSLVGGIAGKSNKIENCQNTGTVSGQASTGGIAGNVQTIKNCINTSDVKGVDNTGGIFGETVKDLEDVYLSGKRIKNRYFLTADNCKNSGNIKGVNYVGGISGDDKTISSGVFSADSLDILVSNCQNSGFVTGKNYVAGIIPVGLAELSFNTGDIQGNMYIGGISGLSDRRMISNCYNTGNIDGKKYVGGITGYGTVYFSYNIGKITGKQKYGPICGDVWLEVPKNIINNLNDIGLNSYQEINTSTSVNCYFLDEDALYSAKKNTSNAKPLTYAQMSKKYCYDNWDFENIWTITAEEKFPEFIKDAIPFNPTDYNSVHKWDGKSTEPFFSNNNHNGKDENHPYLIYNVKQLAYLAEKINQGDGFNNKYFRLENDIEINGTKDLNENKIPWVRYATEWISIGSNIDYNNDVDEKTFQGIFDGNNHSISGVYGNSLFGRVENCVIKNIKVTNSYIHSSYYSGGICTRASNSVLENCSFDGYIYSYNAGGISGRTETTVIENCANYGTILGAANIGGICCQVSGCNINNCFNTGNISGVESIGGIVGTSLSSCISKSFNSGNISGTLFVGGIVGDGTMDQDDTIKNSYNTGLITCGYIGAGGIIGVIDNVSSKVKVIQNCYNSGIVSVEKSEYDFSLSKNMYSGIAKNIVNGCIVGITAPNSLNSYYEINNCYYLENNYCKNSIGLNLAIGKDYSKSLSAEEMQNKNSFPASWFSEDGAWTLTEGNEAYLFPQLKCLPHVPGNEYSFSYVSAETGETKIASASPYVFSNKTNYFHSVYNMEGVYEELFDILLNKETQNSMLAKAEVELYKMKGSQYGHCFGMSAVMALYMMGLIDVNDFQWQAKSPFNFLNPVNSNTIESLINYFQLSQSIDILHEKILKKGINRKARTNNTASELIEALKTNDCVLLGITSYVNIAGNIDGDCGSHCVVAYNNGELTEDGGTIGIWDPDNSQSVTGITIEKNGEDYNIIGKSDFYLSYIVTADDLKPVYELLNNNISLLNLENFSSDKVKTTTNTPGKTATDDVNLITSYENFEIKDENNKTATVINGEVQESSEFKIDSAGVISENECSSLNPKEDLTQSENKALPLRQFGLPKNSSSYTITPIGNSGNSDTTLLCSEKEKWYSIVNSEELTEIDFNIAKKEVETESDKKTTQKIVSGYKEADTSWDNVTVEGTTKGIQKTIDKDECCFTSDSNTEMTIIAGDGINETDKCKVEVYENEETVISETQKADKQRTREMEIDNEYKETLGYTVFFESGTDEYNKSVSVEPGKPVPEPDTIKNPKQSANYIFRGWYTENGRKWDFKKDTVNSNIRLIAKWEEIKIKPQIKATILERKTQMTVSNIDNFDRITWNSLNGKVATIDSDSGMLKLKKRGVSTIVATIYSGDTIYESQYSLRVYNPIEYVFVTIGDYLKKMFGILK